MQSTARIEKQLSPTRGKISMFPHPHVEDHKRDEINMLNPIMQYARASIPVPSAPRVSPRHLALNKEIVAQHASVPQTPVQEPALKRAPVVRRVFETRHREERLRVKKDASTQTESPQNVSICAWNAVGV